jgi:hypothetical protein
MEQIKYPHTPNQLSRELEVSRGGRRIAGRSEGEEKKSFQFVLCVLSERQNSGNR